MILANGQLVLEGYIFDTAVAGPWVAERAKIHEWNPLKSQAIARVVKGQIVGGVLYTECNGVNVLMHVAGEGNWLSRKMLQLCFEYPFKHLKVRRVTGIVISNNLEARKFDEHLGFRLEATLKDAHPEGDLLIYCMTAAECRWLKGTSDALQQPRPPIPPNPGLPETA